MRLGVIGGLDPGDRQAARVSAALPPPQAGPPASASRALYSAREREPARPSYEQGRSVPTVEKLFELLAAVAPGEDFILQQSAAAPARPGARP